MPLGTSALPMPKQKLDKQVDYNMLYELEWQAIDPVQRTHNKPNGRGYWVLKLSNAKVRIYRKIGKSLASACLSDIQAITQQKRLRDVQLNLFIEKRNSQRSKLYAFSESAAAIAKVAASEMKETAWHVCLEDAKNRTSSKMDADGFGVVSEGGFVHTPKIQPARPDPSSLRVDPVRTTVISGGLQGLLSRIDIIWCMSFDIPPYNHKNDGMYCDNCGRIVCTH